jgi:hypothetical protein
LKKDLKMSKMFDIACAAMAVKERWGSDQPEGWDDIAALEAWDRLCEEVEAKRASRTKKKQTPAVMTAANGETYTIGMPVYKVSSWEGTWIQVGVIRSMNPAGNGEVLYGPPGPAISWRKHRSQAGRMIRRDLHPAILGQYYCLSESVAKGICVQQAWSEAQSAEHKLLEANCRLSTLLSRTERTQNADQ